MAERDVADIDGATEVFEEHRSLLLGVAYRMLGRMADADDVVQDTWLRWSTADRSAVREPRAYLVRTTTRLAIDRLRQVQTRREAYVGPWLPDPVPTSAGGGLGGTVPDSADRVLLAESVSLAVLVVLESLSPLERAVFVLREAFGFPHAEIATVLDRGEPAVRQIAARARRNIDARKPRFEVDPEQQRTLTERFLSAATGGDLRGLMDVLAPDVRLVSDTDGRVKAPRRVVESADKVARLFAAVGQEALPDLDVRWREINGVPSVLVSVADRPYAAFSVDVADGRIQTVYLMGNPGRIAHLFVD